MLSEPPLPPVTAQGAWKVATMWPPDAEGNIVAFQDDPRLSTGNRLGPATCGIDVLANRSSQGADEYCR